MMQHLKMEITPSGSEKPDTRIKLPLANLDLSINLLPRRIKESLRAKGIHLTELAQLFAKQGPKGKLIDIETHKEKITVSIE
jgi:hypothetical protein